MKLALFFGVALFGVSVFAHPGGDAREFDREVVAHKAALARAHLGRDQCKSSATATVLREHAIARRALLLQTLREDQGFTHGKWRPVLSLNLQVVILIWK